MNHTNPTGIPYYALQSVRDAAIKRTLSRNEEADQLSDEFLELVIEKARDGEVINSNVALLLALELQNLRKQISET